MENVKYAVIDHHSMWGWPKQETTPEEAQVVFVWNDFTIEDDVKRWQSEGKKVICFEHGWNAFFDYEYNKRPLIADGYMSLGYSSYESLLSYGLDKSKLFISGNPNFDTLNVLQTRENVIPKILYTALHWTRDMTEYNNMKLNETINTLAPFSEISVKTIDKSKINVPDSIKEWRSNIDSNYNLFKEIRNGLKNYDIVLTPKESTFDFIAIKMGKKVFRIGKPEEYRNDKDPQTRNILALSDISTELLHSYTKPIVNLDKEISQSIKINKIIEWAQNI